MLDKRQGRSLARQTVWVTTVTLRAAFPMPFTRAEVGPIPIGAEIWNSRSVKESHKRGKLYARSINKAIPIPPLTQRVERLSPAPQLDK